MGAHVEQPRGAGAVRRRPPGGAPKPGPRRAGAPAGGRDPGRTGAGVAPDKTRIACLTRGQQGVDFLGFHLRKVESWRLRGRDYFFNDTATTEIYTVLWEKQHRGKPIRHVERCFSKTSI